MVKLSVLVGLVGIIVYSVGHTKILLASVDKLFWLLTYLDGVEEYNYRQPNYMDGNWRPVVETLNNVEIRVEGN